MELNNDLVNYVKICLIEWNCDVSNNNLHDKLVREYVNNYKVESLTDLYNLVKKVLETENHPCTEIDSYNYVLHAYNVIDNCKNIKKGMSALVYE